MNKPQAKSQPFILAQSCNLIPNQVTHPITDKLKLRIDKNNPVEFHMAKIYFKTNDISDK